MNYISEQNFRPGVDVITLENNKFPENDTFPAGIRGKIIKMGGILACVRMSGGDMGWFHREEIKEE